MSQTYNLYAIKNGYVDQERAGAVIHPDSSQLYEISGTPNAGNRKYIFFGFEQMPSAAKHLALTNVRLRGHTKQASNVEVAVWPVHDFDPDTLTYNNYPNNISASAYRLTNMLYTGEDDRWFELYSGSGISARTTAARQFLTERAVRFSTDRVDTDVAYVKTVLEDGVTTPYLEITVDETTIVRSQVEFETKPTQGATINNAASILFSWKYSRAGGQNYFCASEEYAQQSAKLYWKKNTDSTWSVINISGPDTRLQAPSGTFPSNATIEYYVEGTDEDGTTTQTSTFSFKTTASKLTASNSPTSGYANPRNPITFSWDYVNAFGVVGSGSTTFHWRVSGAENWTDVQAATGSNRLTIPANTFQVASTIQWYLSGTDAIGYASQTSVYSFSTAASAVTAQAVSPSNTVQSNNQPITFNWTYSSSDGFAPSRYKFMWKLVTDANWTTLVDSTDVVNTYTFPAYTFPAGEIRWGVVPYNIDEVAGTGQSVTFVCYGAPDAPVVYAENAPFTTVTWQASDQQSYRIKVDDVVYGPYFGTEKTFAIPDRLEDGEHTIGVSVVGTYGLWSEWGTSIINVQNVPGAEIVLGGTGGIDTFLSWTTAEATSDFLVFRDGVQIGHTEEITFVDRYAVGEHTYKVINRLPSGNYSESNEVVLESHADGTYISLLDGGEWLKIKYMLKDSSDQQYEESIETVYNHFAGSDYPSVSISRYRERRLSYSAVFLYVDEADHTAFKNMLRKPVVMKFENGNVIAGVIDSWTVIHRKQYYTAYTFTLRQIEFEDYTDDTT